MPRMQGLAMGKGWQAVWDVAVSNGDGRSGGTAVLVRRPAQVMRGGPMNRGTVAVTSWTRRNRLHVASAYDAHEADPGYEQTARVMPTNGKHIWLELQVPLGLQGDWHMGAEQAGQHWDRSQARILNFGAATQRQGRNLDSMIASVPTRTWDAEAVAASTEHVWVQARLQAVDADTLGVRMEKRPE